MNIKECHVKFYQSQHRISYIHSHTKLLKLDMKLQCFKYILFQRSSNFKLGNDENYPLITTKISDFTNNFLPSVQRVVHDCYTNNIPVRLISLCGRGRGPVTGAVKGAMAIGSPSIRCVSHDFILFFQDLSPSCALDKMIVDDGSVYIASYKTPKVKSPVKHKTIDILKVDSNLKI